MVPTTLWGRACWSAGLVAACAAGCAPWERHAPLGALDPIEERSTWYPDEGLNAPPPREEPPDLDDTPELSDYLAYAALNNPTLEAAFNRWKAALARVPQVRALPDPRFTYRFFVREVETRVGPQQQAVGLAQTFPWLGKLSLRGDVALEAARAARKRYDAEKLRLFYRVRHAYYEYYYLSRAITVVRKNRDLVKYLEGVARTKYKAGSAAQAEVIRAQVELGKLEDALRSLLDLRGPIIARLNAALNRPIEKDVPEPKAIPEEHIDLTDEQALICARRANPELAALDHDVAEQRRTIELAGKEYFPDITMGIDYTDVGSPPGMAGPGLGNPAALRSLSRITGGMGDTIDAYAIGKSFQPGNRPDDAGKDIWVLTVSVNLPIRHGKYAAGEREARARYRAAVSTKTDRENALSAQIKQVLYDFRDAERKIDLYRDTLVPKAAQNLNATEVAYRAGTASFLDLIDAERSLLEFELLYERALANHVQRLSELEMLVGRAIPRKEPTSDLQEAAPNPNTEKVNTVTP